MHLAMSACSGTTVNSRSEKSPRRIWLRPKRLAQTLGAKVMSVHGKAHSVVPHHSSVRRRPAYALRSALPREQPFLVSAPTAGPALSAA